MVAAAKKKLTSKKKKKVQALRLSPWMIYLQQDKGNQTALFFVLFIIVAFINIIRDPSNLFSPNLCNEAGRDFFAYYYNHPELKNIFRVHPGGYILFTQNLIAVFSHFFPITIVPFVMSLIPFIINSLALVLFYSKPLNEMIPNHWFRFATCISIALFLVGDCDHIANIGWLAFGANAVLYLLILTPLPKTTIRIIFRFLICGLLIFTSPLSVLIIPPLLYLIYLNRTKKEFIIYGSSLIFLSTVYFIFFRESGTGAINWFQTPILFIRLMFERVLFDLFIGTKLRMYLYYHQMGYICTIAGVCFLSAIIWGLIKHKKLSPWGWICCYFILSALFLGLFRIGTHDISVFPAPVHNRYFLIPKIFTLILVGYLIYPYSRWFVSITGKIVCFLFILWILKLNIDNNFLYKANTFTPQNGKEIQAFVQHVSELEKKLGGKKGVHTRLDRGPIWTIEFKR